MKNEPLTDKPLRHALGLPEGSVRAILALLMSASIWWWMWKRPDSEIPPYLQNVLFIILGHYFAARHHDIQRHQHGPPPLWLPKGTVRTILVSGFLATGVMLFYHHRMVSDGRLNHAGVTLILVITFLVGVLLRKIFPHHKTPNIVHDIEAILALISGVLLFMLVFEIVKINSPIERLTVEYRLEHLLAGMVGFYFGTKS